jgi:phytoene dehydrogenase-like protein
MSMSGNRSVQAIVVGAGLAGLACAADLTAAGVAVQVLEADSAVGGRMRTDQRAGFLLDRGFQVFNTSYPQVRRRLALPALQLCPFTPGMLLHTAAGRVRFADPCAAVWAGRGTWPPWACSVPATCCFRPA